MSLLIATTIVLLAIFYLNYAFTTAKERKVKESVVYNNAKNEWQNIQLWYRQKHPKRALPYAFIVDSGSWIGVQMNVYNEKGNINFQEDLTPSEYIIAIKKIKEHLQQYGYKS